MTKQDSPTTAVPNERRKELIDQLESIDFSDTSIPQLILNRDELEKLADFIESYGNRRELEGQAKAHESYMYGSRIFSVPNVVYHFGGEDIPKKFAQLINAESKRRRDETLAAMQSQKGSTNE